jgi:DedD protein
MAFFKFRKSGDEQSATAAQPESVDAMRRRAKYRLIGAAVLVLIGVIGFPLLFDKQPRPIAVDTPIEIPDKAKGKSLNVPAAAAVESVKSEVATPELSPAPTTPVAEAVTAPKIDTKVAVAGVAVAAVASKLIAKKEPDVVEKVAEKSIEKAVVKAVEKPVSAVKPVVKPAAKPDEAAKAQALLDGKGVDKKNEAAEGRFVVQVGAFADVLKAREARSKVEHMGLKTYTQVVETKEGRRIRVRVGPFTAKVEADKAAQKIKKLALPASVLTL